MTFLCAHCGRPADRDLPPPPPDVTVIFICHACSWDVRCGEDAEQDDPT